MCKLFFQERRELKFWYEELAKVNNQVVEALTDTYYKELMNKENFPKGKTSHCSIICSDNTVITRHWWTKRVFLKSKGILLLVLE